MTNDNTEYILFLDESSVTKVNQYLLLGGIAIARKEYKENLIPSIQQCKVLLGDPHIVFHYTDIIKKQKAFKCMCSNSSICTDFWDKLRDGLKKSDFTVFSAYIDDEKYNVEYPKNIRHDSYELLFSTVINNYIHFLQKHNARGSVIFESREETQNRKIQQYYFHMMKYGTNIYQATAIEQYITTTSFLVKEENCIGLQIADLVAYNSIKHVNGKKIEHNIWEIIEPKIYDGKSNNTQSYGLVKLF